MPALTLDLMQRSAFDLGDLQGQRIGESLGNAAVIRSRIATIDERLRQGNSLIGQPGSLRELLTIGGVFLFLGTGEAQIVAGSSTVSAEMVIPFLQGQRAGLSRALAKIAGDESQVGFAVYGAIGGFAVPVLPAFDPKGSGFTLW